MKIAEMFDREVRSTLERLMTLLVPALTIGLGLIIAADHRRRAHGDPLGLRAAAVTPAVRGRCALSPARAARSIAGSDLY